MKYRRATLVSTQYKGTVIGITQPPPTEGAWSALFSNLSNFGLDNYVVKRSKRPLLEEVLRYRLPCPIKLVIFSGGVLTERAH